MKTASEVTCIGEVLVDFVSNKSGVNLSEAPGFMKLAGGASANVAVGLAKLGIRSGFVGRVGNDSFGKFLCGELEKNGVDTSGVRSDKQHKTRLAFVSLTKSGERDFEFWENHPADEQLGITDVLLEDIARSRIVNVSSFLFLKEPARSTAMAITRHVSGHGGCVAFDPNIRLSLWKSETKAREVLLEMIIFSNILRLNEDEARFLSGTKDLKKAARKLQLLGPSLVVATLGGKGCYVHTARHSRIVKGFKVKCVDTTGCGDGFLAGLLCGILNAKEDLDNLSESDFTSICRFANAVGALTAMRYGVFDALPKLTQVKNFLKNNR